MAISNELSTEVATAILARQKTDRDTKELMEIVLAVHVTLQDLALQARASRRSVTADSYEKKSH